MQQLQSSKQQSQRKARPASSRSTLCPDQGGGAVQCCALAPAVLQVPRAAAKAYAMDRYACSKLSPVTGVSTHTC